MGVQRDSQKSEKRFDRMATPKALELLRVLKQGPKTRSEMMESMNLKDVMNFFKNYISPALEAKYIAMQYPDPPKHPNQKYSPVGDQESE